MYIPLLGVCAAGGFIGCAPAPDPDPPPPLVPQDADTDTDADSDTDTDSDTDADTDSDTDADTDTDTDTDVDAVVDARPIAGARATFSDSGAGCTELSRQFGDALGDGGTDLVVRCSNRVLLLPATTTGTAELAASAVGSLRLSWPQELAGAGDLTGDGVLDLVVFEQEEYTKNLENYYGDLTVWRVPGPWTLNRTTDDADISAADGSDTEPGIAVVLDDIDGDAIADAAWSPGNWNVGFLHYLPEGASTGSTAYVMGLNSLTGAVSAGDLDGDGLGDLVLEDLGGACVIPGPFDSAKDCDDAVGRLWASEESPRAAGDVDADGYDDLLYYDIGSAWWSTSDDAVYVLRGPVVTEWAHASDLAWAAFYGVTTGDAAELDGDDGRELLLGEPGATRSGAVDTGAVYVFLKPSAGRNERADADRAWYGRAGDTLGTGITALPDLDADGVDDAAFAGVTGIWVLGAP